MEQVTVSRKQWRGCSGNTWNHHPCRQHQLGRFRPDKKFGSGFDSNSGPCPGDLEGERNDAKREKLAPRPRGSEVDRAEEGTGRGA
ncbi:hypothetical protein PG996_016107 [Apiospora saccharicola]|uniref:Uncharacterized protein n=1 Tax=Apiospora saccharicola TaxID=335842 RepID=A0ABR1TMZ3_9PEZI